MLSTHERHKRLARQQTLNRTRKGDVPFRELHDRNGSEEKCHPFSKIKSVLWEAAESEHTFARQRNKHRRSSCKDEEEGNGNHIGTNS